MKRYLHTIAAGALTASLSALPDLAAAQLTTGITVDTNAVGNSLAIPFITRSANDPLGYAATVINIGNTKDLVFNQAGPVYLHFEVISGDPADNWRSQDSVCITTPRETTQIIFEPTVNGSVMTFECSLSTATPGIPGDHTNKSFAQAPSVNAKSGILWVTQETVPHSGVYMDGNILEGRAHVLEFGNGSAFTLAAIPFEALADFDGSDGEWRFDGKEFPNAPLNWTASVILPAVGVQAHLLLFSLDGNLAAGKGPNPKFEYEWYDDDENRQQSNHSSFDCFAWINLDTDLGVRASVAGTPTGSLALRHVRQTSINDVPHDARHDAGVSDLQRVIPFYGYLVQRFNTGGMIQKPNVPPAQAGTGVAPNIGPNQMFANNAATAYLLTKGANAMIPTPGDRPAMTRN